MMKIVIGIEKYKRRQLDASDLALGQRVKRTLSYSVGNNSNCLLVLTNGRIMIQMRLKLIME
ncbi:MAG: hypothetical protein WA941_15985 [Nitrososphaeraceae archaeon]